MASLPRLGETISGFTVTELGTVHMLGVRTVLFNHESSGTQLLYIQNDDREPDFNLIYRTPQMDERDNSHILEHLIPSSCKKYPSRDIFFDVDSKSYTTFMNGLTDNTSTCCPVCNQNQKQLLELMDVSLYCMEESDALKDKNFYLREATRYELSSVNGPLTMQDTVLSEDWGHLTDILENANSTISHTLYEGSRTANLLGRAHLHYRGLSYEQAKETSKRCYSYSNCLITLYGSMDYGAILNFLDRERFSRAASKGRSLLGEFEEPVKSGLRTCAAQSPAYHGSPSEHASVMDYGIDLSGCTKEELVYWDPFADILDDDTSPWHRYARGMGLNHAMEVYLGILLPHPSLKFHLRNGDSCPKEALLGSIGKALKDICRDGLSPKPYRASMKENRLISPLTRGAPHLDSNLSEEIGRYWSTIGRTDYSQLYEETFRRFEKDSDQAVIKKLAATALHPRTSVLAMTQPVLGLAEQLEEEKEQYLNEELASMTVAEQKQSIGEATAFHDWNSRQRSNIDFLIRPQELPESAKPCSFTKRQRGTITCYTSPFPSQGVGSCRFYFDISRTGKDDLNYLMLCQVLLTELDTKRFTVEQQKNLEQEHLHDCIFGELYPAGRASPQDHPMMSIFWFGLTEDFEAGLGLLLDVMGGGDYSDTDTIVQALEKCLPDHDQSEGDNASALAFSLFGGYARQEYRFRSMLNSQENYYFLKDVLKRLKEDPDFGAIAAFKLKAISHTILSRRGPVFLVVTLPDVLGSLGQAAVDILGGLPVFKEDHDSSALVIWIPDQKQKLAVCVEASCRETWLVDDFYENPGLKGHYLPFLMAVADKYLKPAIRYQGGACDSGIDFCTPVGYFSLWSTADPKVRSIQKLFLAAGAQLMELPLTRGGLDGYTLNAYARALPPSGILSTRMRHMHRGMVNMDSCKINEMISDIKNADLCRRQGAARITDEILGRSAIVTVGSEKCIMRGKDVSDQVLIYHTNYA